MGKAESLANPNDDGETRSLKMVLSSIMKVVVLPNIPPLDPDEDLAADDDDMGGEPPKGVWMMDKLSVMTPTKDQLTREARLLGTKY